MAHQHVNDVKTTPIVIGISEEIGSNFRVGSKIAFHSMDQMRMVKKDFCCRPFPAIVVPETA
jgi:hypothetical protein